MAGSAAGIEAVGVSGGEVGVPVGTAFVSVDMAVGVGGTGVAVGGTAWAGLLQAARNKTIEMDRARSLFIAK